MSPYAQDPRSVSFPSRDELMRALAGAFPNDEYLQAHRTRLGETVARAAPFFDSATRVLDVGTYGHVPYLLYRHFGVRNCSGCSEGGGSVDVCTPARDAQPAPAEPWHLDIDAVDIERGSWPYGDRSFDVILLLEVLEHMQEHPVFVMKELHRVLRDSGKLILTTPNSSSLRAIVNILHSQNPYLWSVYGANRKGIAHVHEYATAELALLLSSTGFLTVTHSTMSPYADDVEGRFPQLESFAFANGMSRNHSGSTHYVVAMKGPAGSGSAYRPLYDVPEHA